MKHLFKKIISCICISSIPFAFFACGDNPIEAENDFGMTTFKNQEQSLEKLDTALTRVDFYKCKQTYGVTRCNSFYAKFGTYETKEIADTINYDDRASFIGEITDDETTNPPKDSISKDTSNYILVNKGLNLTFKSFLQKVDSISSDKESCNPEVKFFVTTFSDGEKVFTQVTPLILDESNIKEWEGKHSSVITIPRGIDEIHICTNVIDENAKNDDVLIDNDCIIINDIGFIENNQVSVVKTSSTKVEATWEWSLFDIK